MPAAAVIPAPIAYINVVAVKKLVVGFLTRTTGPNFRVRVLFVVSSLPYGERVWHSVVAYGTHIIYCEKIRVFKAGNRCEYISME